MTEAELILIISEYENRSLTLLTWIFSTAMGLYSIGYIVGTKIRLGTVVFVSISYIGFQLVQFGRFINISALRQAAGEQLEQLYSQNSQIPPLADRQLQIIFEAPPIWFTVGTYLFLIIVVASVGYLIYQHFIGRKSDDSST